MEEICNICNKKFDSKESLSQHNSAKHNSLVTVGEDKKVSYRKYFIIAGIIVATILFSLSFYIRAQKPSQYDDFARCLTEKGAVVYGNDFCQYTTRQLNWFGKSEEYLSYVKCIDNKALCDSKGVVKTPTWEINGKTYPGTQTFEKLSELSGCKL